MGPIPLELLRLLQSSRPSGNAQGKAPPHPHAEEHIFVLSPATQSLGARQPASGAASIVPADLYLYLYLYLYHSISIYIYIYIYVYMICVCACDLARIRAERRCHARLAWLGLQVLTEHATYHEHPSVDFKLPKMMHRSLQAQESRGSFQGLFGAAPSDKVAK